MSITICNITFFLAEYSKEQTARVTNEEVFRRAGVDRKLMQDMRSRQLNFLGHVMRKGGLENLAMTGKVEGKRSRGRKRVTWMSSLKKWLEGKGVQDQETELLEKANNRTLWHIMIAKVSEYGT